MTSTPDRISKKSIDMIMSGTSACKKLSRSFGDPVAEYASCMPIALPTLTSRNTSLSALWRIDSM